MNDVINWLLDGPQWIAYRTRLDLLKQSEDDLAVKEARRAMLSDTQVKGLISELAEWPGPPLGHHMDPHHLLYKLAFAADIGLKLDDPGMGGVIERILAHRSADGPFQVTFRIDPAYGGSGEEQWGWMLCDAPVVIYALAELGLSRDRRIIETAESLAGLVQEGGWCCARSSEFGSFQEPGGDQGPCPMATLLMLKALSVLPEDSTTGAARVGAEALLNLWDNREKLRPHLFAMGSKFASLKAPFIWYDILHVVDVLTRFTWLRGDHRLQEMLAVIRAKADRDGRLTPEAIWPGWENWEFAQTERPSRWVTLVALRALSQTGLTLPQE